MLYGIPSVFVFSANASEYYKSKILIIKQAALLKNCGSILQTPAEPSKTSGATTEAPVSENVSNSNFTSKIPDTSDLEILWDEKHELSSHLVREQEKVGPSQINCMR